MLMDLPAALHKKNRLAGVHHGEVVDNEDPEKIGCVQIKVPGVVDVTDGGSEEDLPWAYPVYEVGGGSVDNQEFRVPNIGAVVLVEFPNNDPYSPYYRGWVPNITLKNDQWTGDEDADYPASYGSIDDQGNYWKVNREQHFIEARSASGVFLRVDDKGNVAVVSPGSLSWIAGGDIRFISNGKIELGAKETMELTALEGMDIASGKHLNLNARGDMDAIAKGHITETAGKDLRLRSGRDLDGLIRGAAKLTISGDGEEGTQLGARGRFHIDAEEKIDMDAKTNIEATAEEGKVDIDADRGNVEISAKANIEAKADGKLDINVKRTATLAAAKWNVVKGAMTLADSLTVNGASVRHGVINVGGTHTHTPGNTPVTGTPTP